MGYQVDRISTDVGGVWMASKWDWDKGRLSDKICPTSQSRSIDELKGRV